MNEQTVVNSTTPVEATPIKKQATDEEVMKFLMKDMTLEELLKSPAFLKAVNSVAVQRNMNPVDVAQGFVGSVLGTVNDFGINGVNTVEEFANNILDLLHGTLKGVTKTTADLGRGLVNTVTLQQPERK